MRFPFRPLPVLLALALGSAGAARMPLWAEESVPPPPTPAAIDAAIEKGTAFVVGKQRSDGTWGTGNRAVGHTALAVFALFHAGLEEDADTREGKALRRALRWLDRHGPGLTHAGDRNAGTYSTSLLLLGLRARGHAAGPRARRLVDLLERMQAKNGQWSYAGLPGRRRHGAGDNSNTQFAVLALGAAVGEGLEVDSEVLKRAWVWWRRAAQPDGGFGYSSGGSPSSASTGSMTAAAIASLAILEAALAGHCPDVGEEDVPVTRVLEGALRRLDDGFAVHHNFGPAKGRAAERQRNAGRGWIHYYLWSVERAMVLAGREQLGETDWYTAGARHLLDTQRRDGSWRGEHPLYATSFALLFLTRAADPPRVFTPPDRLRGPVTPGPAPPGLAPPGAGPREEVPPGDVGDWLEEGLPPDVLCRACLAKGAGSLAPLVQALAHRDAKVRQRANETLRALLGDERVGRADGHPLARGRLKLWVRRNARFLVPSEGRFVLP